MADIAQVEVTLWKYIRKSQAAGKFVRSWRMAERLGGLGGSAHPESVTVCLIGTLGNSDFGMGRIEHACRFLGLTRDELLTLEEGFETWLSACPESPYYKLGVQIAKTLEEEEVANK